MIREGSEKSNLTPRVNRSNPIANWIRRGKAAKSEFHNQSRDARRFLGIIVNPPPTKAAPITGLRVNEISGPRTTCGPFSTSVGLLKSTCPPNGEPCKTGSCRHRSQAWWTIWWANPLPRRFGSTTTVASSIAPPTRRNSAYPAISPDSRMMILGV